MFNLKDLRPKVTNFIGVFFFNLALVGDPIKQWQCVNYLNLGYTSVLL